MFNFAEIEIEMIQRAEKRAESKLKIKEKPGRFGSAKYFRRFKKVKPKNFTRQEPPILKQNNPFSGESCTVPIEKRFKAGKRPKISL